MAFVRTWGSDSEKESLNKEAALIAEFRECPYVWRQQLIQPSTLAASQLANRVASPGTAANSKISGTVLKTILTASSSSK